VVDAHFRNTFANGRAVAEVAVLGTTQADLDRRLPGVIPQALKPAIEWLCCVDHARVETVSYLLR
jgi:hypothetical protein